MKKQSWLGLFLLLLLASCATGDDGGLYNAMITKRTPLYLGGVPEPGNHPSGHFEPGMRLRILSRHGRYVKVQAVGGMQGYIDADAVGELRERRQSGPL